MTATVSNRGTAIYVPSTFTDELYNVKGAMDRITNKSKEQASAAEVVRYFQQGNYFGMPWGTAQKWVALVKQLKPATLEIIDSAVAEMGMVGVARQ